MPPAERTTPRQAEARVFPSFESARAAAAASGYSSARANEREDGGWVVGIPGRVGEWTYLPAEGWDACTQCETVFDGDTPRTTPSCEHCGTCGVCGCQVNLDTIGADIHHQRGVLNGRFGYMRPQEIERAETQLALLEAHLREVS